MRILINCSGLKVGGGLQVADSFLHYLGKYTEHEFVVVLSTPLAHLADGLRELPNVACVEIYDIKQTPKGVFWGRNRHLDSIAERENINAVYTIFGPSLWRPKALSISGFARSQIVYANSLFFRTLGWKMRLKYKIMERIRLHNFRCTSDAFVTENPDVTRLFQKISGKPTFTATNNCNQVFADASRQLNNINLPPFRGLTLLTIASNYPHKNLGIIARVAEALARRGIRDVRFVVTVTEAELPVAREASSLVHHLGAVKIEQCPGLYRQADVMFLPTLLECFSASYAEAMQMQVPILTSDEPFAHGLCGDAAMYCNTLSVDSVIAAIESLRAWTMRRDLAVHGIERLKTFDTAEQRADKYIKIIESCYKTLNK